MSKIVDLPSSYNNFNHTYIKHSSKLCEATFDKIELKRDSSVIMVGDLVFHFQKLIEHLDRISIRK